MKVSKRHKAIPIDKFIAIEKPNTTQFCDYDSELVSLWKIKLEDKSLAEVLMA